MIGGSFVKSILHGFANQQSLFTLNDIDVARNTIAQR